MQPILFFNSSKAPDKAYIGDWIPRHLKWFYDTAFAKISTAKISTDCKIIGELSVSFEG
jgi:hypothetical protein